MRIISIFIFAASFFCAVNAQEAFEMERYLASAFTDQTLENSQSQLNFLGENNYNAPWLNRLELRVGSEDANASLNQYRIRLSPTNPAEIKANKKYYKQHLNVLDAQQKVAFNEALMNRYGLILDLAYLANRQLILKERIKIQNLFIQNMAGGSDQNLSLKDLVDVQTDQSKNLLRLEEIESLIAQTLHFIQLDYGTFSLESQPIKELISISQIKNYISLSAENGELRSLEAESIKNELELNRLELNIDKAEARSNIGYIQSNIDTERGKTWNEHIGIQIGVRIPIVNPDKPSLNRQRVELLEEEAKTESKLLQLEQDQKLNAMVLERLLNRYQLVLDRITVAEALPLTGASQVDWGQVLALKNYQFQLLEEKAETEKQIREAYLDYLEKRGILVGTPIINYLSTHFSPIGQG